MKKILALIMAVAMVASTFVFVIPSSAEETTPADTEVTETAVKFQDVVMTPTPLQTTEDMISTDGTTKTVTYSNGKKVSWNASKEGLSNIEVRRMDRGNAQYNQIASGDSPAYTIVIPEAGKYIITVGYSTKTDKIRLADYSVNGSAPAAMKVDSTVDAGEPYTHDRGECILVELGEFDLVKGENTVAFSLPDDRPDGSSSVYIDYVMFESVEGAEPEKGVLAHYTFDSADEAGLKLMGNGQITYDNGAVSFENADEKHAWLEADIDLRGVTDLTFVARVRVDREFAGGLNWVYEITSDNSRVWSTPSWDQRNLINLGIEPGRVAAEATPGNWVYGNTVAVNPDEAFKVGDVITVVVTIGGEGETHTVFENKKQGEIWRLPNVGAEEAAMTPVYMLVGNDPVFTIGKAAYGTGEYSNLSIDEIVVLNYAMTAEEVANDICYDNPDGLAHEGDETKWAADAEDSTIHNGECKYCGAAMSHKESPAEVDDCTKDVTCTECGLVLKKGKPDHDFENGTVVSNGEGTRKHTITCANDGCKQTHEEDCTPDTDDCTKEAHCTECKALYRDAGEHTVTEWKDNGETHDGVCDVCKLPVSHDADLKHEDEDDCTSDLVCQVEGCTVTEKGEAEHDFEHGTYKPNDDGKTHTITCKNCKQTTTGDCEEKEGIPCSEPGLCVCGRQVRDAGKHKVDEWTVTVSDDGETETHSGVCESCGTKVSHEAKADEDDGDCTTEVKCVGDEQCTVVMVEAEKAHTPDTTKAPTSDGEGHHTYPCANDGCTKTVEEDCKSVEELPCDQAEKCVCGYETKHAGKHSEDIEYKLDEKTGMHVGTCPDCKTELSHAPIPADRTDCTEDVVCEVCGLSIVEGCADHAWSEWEDDGEGHHVRKCQNEWCVGEESEDHTYTDADERCPVCDAVNPNYKAPATTDPAETDPAETDPAETDPAVTEPAETEPAVTEPAETTPAEPGVSGGDEGGKDGPPKTGDSGIAIFAALAVVSAASIALTVYVPGKKRH